MGKYNRKFLLLDSTLHSHYGETYSIPYGLECTVLESDGYSARIHLDENEITLEKFASPVLGGYKCLSEIVAVTEIIFLCPATSGNKRVVEEIRNLNKQTSEKMVSLEALKYEDPYFVRDKTHELSRDKQIDLSSENFTLN